MRSLDQANQDGGWEGIKSVPTARVGWLHLKKWKFGLGHTFVVLGLTAADPYCFYPVFLSLFFPALPGIVTVYWDEVKLFT